MTAEVIMKSSLFVVATVLLALLIYFFYLWYTYIDETVTSGEAYGFTIGDTKFDTYNKISGAISDLNYHPSSVFIEIEVNEDLSELLATDPGYKIMANTLLHEGGYNSFKGKDRWDFYFNRSYFNSLSLKFCEDKLCEIYRHRKFFEIP